jgi:hypothetical protein
MRCESCGESATQIRDEYSYCDKCWARKFSTTGGVPFKQVLKEGLEKIGMMRKDGESIDQWSKRCRERTPLKQSVGKLHDNLETL